MPNGQSLWNDELFNSKGLLGTTMYVRTYDPTTFDLNQPGSVVVLPSIYMIFIERNFYLHFVTERRREILLSHLHLDSSYR
jgi:hypothetical protein